MSSMYSHPGEEAALSGQRMWREVVDEVMEPFRNKEGLRNESPADVVRIYDMMPQKLMDICVQLMGQQEFMKYKQFVDRCRKLLPEE